MLCGCPACECNCGLHSWNLGLVVMFSLTKFSFWHAPFPALWSCSPVVLAHRVSQMPLFTCVACTKDFVGADDLLQIAVGSETLPNCTFLYFSLEKRHLNHSQHDAKYLQHLKYFKYMWQATI